MTDRIDGGTALGGGDAGLLAGLSLGDLNPDLEVTIADDCCQPHPQIGTASWLQIRPLTHGTLDIDEKRFVRGAKPVRKMSAYSRDRSGHPEFQEPPGVSEDFPEQHRDVDGASPDHVEAYLAHEEFYRTGVGADRLS